MLEQFIPNEILQLEYLGNSVENYIVALIAFILLLLIFGIFQRIFLNRLRKFAERTKTDIDDTLIAIVQSVRPPFYAFLAFYFAIKFLVLHEYVGKAIDAILIIWVVYLSVQAVQILIDFIVRKRIRKEDEKSSKSAFKILSLITKIILWSLGLLLILSNLGVDITSLIAGFGIGGIAIALAIQNILSDLFSSFAIFFDKPFVVGDYIIVGESEGKVEKIGIKTTRLKALQGEEIIISNKELTSSRIQNFKRMDERRIIFHFGVTYETDAKTVRHIPKIIKEIIKEVKLARFDRAHFKRFDDSALTFEVVYYVQSNKYAKYMDMNEKIHLKIKEAFDKEGISMAYPTQTIYIERNE